MIHLRQLIVHIISDGQQEIIAMTSLDYLFVQLAINVRSIKQSLWFPWGEVYVWNAIRNTYKYHTQLFIRLNKICILSMA